MEERKGAIIHQFKPLEEEKEDVYYEPVALPNNEVYPRLREDDVPLLVYSRATIDLIQTINDLQDIINEGEFDTYYQNCIYLDEKETAKFNEPPHIYVWIKGKHKKEMLDIMIELYISQFDNNLVCTIEESKLTQMLSLSFNTIPELHLKNLSNETTSNILDIRKKLAKFCEERHITIGLNGNTE